MVKNPAANAGDTRHVVSIPSPLGVGKSPKRRRWQHAPGKLWTEEPGGLRSMGLQGVGRS